jgi:hypothetical protein
MQRQLIDLESTARNAGRAQSINDGGCPPITSLKI